MVAYIGSHGLSHGLGAVLDAAAAQPDVTYLLVGDGADRDRLLAERDRRQLQNVIMRPSVAKADVPGLYAAADVCLVPLRDVPLFEAFVPSKLFEVLAAGRPVIGAVRGEARRDPGALGRRAAGRARARRPAGCRPSSACAPTPICAQRWAARAEHLPRQHYDRDVLAARYLDAAARRSCRPVAERAHA